MKSYLHKSTFLFLITLFAFQVQAQTWTVNGTYKISTSGLATELYMTIDPSSGGLVWAAELAGNDPTQVWTITDHRLPASTGYMEITADLSSFGAGSYTMIADQTSFTGAGDKNITITVRPGLPIADNTDLNYGYDQFQRRKTSGFSGTGNNALFVKVPGEGGSRYGVIPSAAGDAVEFDGGGIDEIKFYLIASLSIEEFDKSSVFISNPVSNELNIEGLTSNFNKVSVYSLLGRELFSKNVNQQSTLSFDVSALSSGMYLVKMQGDKESFVRKIVKQ